MVAFVPRVAAKNAPYGEVKSLERAVLFDSLQRIGRTGWFKPAGRRLERGNDTLVNYNGRFDDGFGKAHDGLS